MSVYCSMERGLPGVRLLSYGERSPGVSLLFYGDRSAWCKFTVLWREVCLV